MGLFLACVRVIVHVCGHPHRTTQLTPVSLSKALLKSVTLPPRCSPDKPQVRTQDINFFFNERTKKKIIKDHKPFFLIKS